MKKVEIILLFVLFLFQNSISNAQNNPIGRYSINFHLKLTVTEKENPDSLVVSSGIFFPFFESNRKKISVLELKNKNIIKLDMNAFVVTIANQIVLISPNDTIEFTFRSNKVVLLGANERYQNYFQNRRTEFDSKYISPLKKYKSFHSRLIMLIALIITRKNNLILRIIFLAIILLFINTY